MCLRCVQDMRAIACWVLVVSCCCCCWGSHIAPQETLSSHFQDTFLSQFPNDMILVHYDNDSYHHLDSLFDRDTLPRGMILFNYDTDKSKLLRPDGYEFLHVIFLRNWREFSRFSRVIGNVRHSDILVFVTLKYIPNFSKSFYFDGVENANVLFIYVINSDVVYTAQFYGNRDGFLEEVAVGKDGKLRLLEMRNTFTDFEDFKFRVAYSDCPPYIYTVCEGRVEGVEMAVLQILAEMMNFEIEMIRFDNFTMPRREMIRAVHRKQVDIAVGCISNTLQRNSMVDFTADIHNEVHTAIYITHDYGGSVSSSFFRIFKPLQFDIWCYILLSIILLGLILKKAADILIGYRTSDLIKFIKIPFRNLVEQPVILPSNDLTIRCIFASWLLTAIIITNSYKSKLASILIKPILQEPDSLPDLVAAGYDFQIPSIDTTFLQETLFNSNDNDFKEILSRWNDGLNMCQSVRKALTSKIAVIEERSNIISTVWNGCKDELTMDEIKMIRMIRQSILPNSHVWALQQSAPFNKRFTTSLEIIQSAGITTALYNNYNLSKPIWLSNQHIPGEDDAHPLNLRTLFGPFIVLSWGAGFASAVFILELLYARYQRRDVVSLASSAFTIMTR
ncbi:PREDICTED: uncharacterized protein LOC108560341 [Nicrophorus vespilloides]|uniref:Uncharacterized protein LOC108560341 n=1 Tax=Nicrophorus vespilloides TaxID=110193 RepID=A0ABM1MFI9_NICVS|nr:PREDICTED: uncharacterized protein LOC108560341 [Nicrophorus vespilloides]